MTKQCQVTKRKPACGKSYTTRGIAKKKKGIGIKITGVNKRRFIPNLVKKRFWFPEESRYVTLRISIAAMRTIDKVGLGTIIRQMRSEGQKV